MKGICGTMEVTENFQKDKVNRAPGCMSDDCTLCMACLNVCPVDAIDLTKDEYGFEQLIINHDKCIGCGRCERVCRKRKNAESHHPILCYAAQYANQSELIKSASGGVFQAIATEVLKKGGICYGSRLVYDYKNGFHAEHARIENEENLSQILNSKYIPSRIGTCYKKAKEDLEAGRTVLFSGTPCQIQGLYAYLNYAEYEGLITLDIICHGVPSTELFNGYIKAVEKLDDVQIIGYNFRDKSISWGTNYSYDYLKRGKERTVHHPRELSSFMAHYLRGELFRENCYRCERANTFRVSDFTCGDYWDIEKEHPEFITARTPHMMLKCGVSCLLVNSEKGQKVLETISASFIMHKVELRSITDHQKCLRQSTSKGKDREKLLELYKKEGYEPIELAYRTKIKNKKRLYLLKNRVKKYMPDVIRIRLYQKMIKK